MKRLLTLVALFLCCISMSAYNISAANEDGITIYYNLINGGTELEVVSPGYGSKYNCSEAIRIPEEVHGKKVTRIGDGAFNEATATGGIDLPNSVTTIGQIAFSQFRGDHITMSSGITTILKGAFRYSNAKKLNFRDEAALAAWCNVDLLDQYSNPLYGYRHSFPNNVTRMGEVCLNGVTLGQLVIPEGVTRIKSYTFLNVDFESVTIPASVETIDKYVFGTGSDEAASISTLIINSDAVASAGHFAQWTTFSDINSPILISKRTWIYHLIFGEGVTCIGESACPYFSISSVDIPNSVTTIGNGAFYNNYWLESVNIPDNVTSIGESAFYGCSYLKSITIPDGVKVIGASAFSGCSSLASVILHCKTIGTWFKGMESIKELVIGDEVTSIVSDAFEGCSGLEKVIVSDIAAWCGIKFGNTYSNPLFYAHHLYSDEDTEMTELVIPDGVTTIGKYAFRGCSGLTSVEIPNSVTSIEESAFSGFTGLTSIQIPNSVTTIEGSAFSSCSSLTSIEIPNSVTSIGSYAFRDCTGLTSANIPESVTSFNESAFSGCRSLTTVTLNNDAIASKARSWSEYTDKTLSSIFGAQVEQYIIGDDVKSIGANAFYKCTNLSSVSIGNNVTTIGGFAFYDCSGLEKVIVRDIAAWCGIKFGNTYSNPLIYAHHLYSDENTEITELVIPDGVTSIGNQAFYGCSGLTSVEIPNSVTSIELNAFRKCSGLTSVTVPNSVVSIGSYAFEGCNGLEKVIVSDIAAWCGINFANGESNPLAYAHHLYSDENTEITELVIPDGVTSFGIAFSGCTGLTSVEIPNSVTSIELNAFRKCSGLTSVTIPNSVVSIGSYAFYDCSSLTSIDIPNSVVSIRNSAFHDCNGLTSIEIPNSVTSIGADAFSGCSGLTSVVIPNSVTSIGNSAFNGCSALRTIISHVVEPFNIDYDVFKDWSWSSVYSNATLYVPVGTKAKYQNTNAWYNFYNIVEANLDDFDRPVTIIPQNYTIAYGDGLPTFEYDSQDVTLFGTPEISCEATSTSPAGTYPITITKGSVANPNATYVNGTLTIEKAPLTITAQDYTIKQGEDLPVFEATYEGFKNNETADVLTTLPTLSTTATSASEPGEYEIAVSGAEAQNYEISYVSGKLTITEASAILNISVEHPVDIYDLQGNKVRSKATSLKGLRKGVYIINGSKIIVK